VPGPAGPKQRHHRYSSRLRRPHNSRSSRPCSRRPRVSRVRSYSSRRAAGSSSSSPLGAGRAASPLLVSIVHAVLPHRIWVPNFSPFTGRISLCTSLSRLPYLYQPPPPPVLPFSCFHFSSLIFCLSFVPALAALIDGEIGGWSLICGLCAWVPGTPTLEQEQTKITFGWYPSYGTLHTKYCPPPSIDSGWAPSPFISLPNPAK
jgi:hypothetical protein